MDGLFECHLIVTYNVQVRKIELLALKFDGVEHLHELPSRTEHISDLLDFLAIAKISCPSSEFLDVLPILAQLLI